MVTERWPGSDKTSLRSPVCGVGLVFEANRLFYHSTLGLRVIKKKKDGRAPVAEGRAPAESWDGTL